MKDDSKLDNDQFPHHKIYMKKMMRLSDKFFHEFKDFALEDLLKNDELNIGHVFSILDGTLSTFLGKAIFYLKIMSDAGDYGFTLSNFKENIFERVDLIFKEYLKLHPEFEKSSAKNHRRNQS